MQPRLALVALAAVLLAGGVWFFTRQTDEAKINRLLDDLTQAGDVDADSNVVTRGLRVHRAFDCAFQPSARADVPEIGGASLDALEQVATGAGAVLHDGQVRLDRRAIVLDEPHTLAEVSATAHLEGHRGGSSISASRPAELQLRKIDGTWKITTLHIGAL